MINITEDADRIIIDAPAAIGRQIVEISRLLDERDRLSRDISFSEEQARALQSLRNKKEMLREQVAALAVAADEAGERRAEAAAEAAYASVMLTATAGRLIDLEAQREAVRAILHHAIAIAAGAEGPGRVEEAQRIIAGQIDTLAAIGIRSDQLSMFARMPYDEMHQHVDDLLEAASLISYRRAG